MPVAAPPRLSLIAVALFLVTLALFLPATEFDYITYDDPQSVTAEPRVTGGFTVANARWALTHAVEGVWHPLTTWSHQVVCSAFGSGPRPAHAVNIALHALTAAVLFLALQALTGGTGRSAFVAALFALHPLRVESVAWVTERKDVLSGLFFALTLLAYAAYVRRPTTLRWLLLPALGALAMLAKPMAVTLPAVLLLLDYWPLRRLPSQLGAAIREKVPLLLVAAAVVAAQLHFARGLTESLDPAARFGYSVAAYAEHLRLVLWPADLAFFYPRPSPPPPMLLLAEGALLTGVTLGAWMLRRRAPWLIIGWLWFVGMLTPIAGWVKLSDTFVADRFTYLPSIGLAIALAWSGAAFSERGPRGRTLVAMLGILILAAAALATTRQLPAWRDSESLYRQALARDPRNVPALTHLAATVMNQPGRRGEAITLLRAALAIDPARFEALTNLALLLSTDPATQPEAAELARRATVAQPGSAAAFNNLGLVLVRTEDRPAAAAAFRRALELDPGYWVARYNLAAALAPDPGRAVEAADLLREVLRARPDFAPAARMLNTLTSPASPATP